MRSYAEERGFHRNQARSHAEERGPFRNPVRSHAEERGPSRNPVPSHAEERRFRRSRHGSTQKNTGLTETCYGPRRRTQTHPDPARYHAEERGPCRFLVHSHAEERGPTKTQGLSETQFGSAEEQMYKIKVHRLFQVRCLQMPARANLRCKALLGQACLQYR